MKTFEQLAQAAYEAHQKEHVRDRVDQTVVSFASLAPDHKDCWRAVARQLWAEFSAIH